MSGRKVITVDGNAGSGKTTLARLLAQRLGFTHFNSGLLYRGAALLVSRYGLSPDNEGEVVRLISSHTIELGTAADGASQLYVDGDEVTDLVIHPNISETTSVISAHRGVREALIPHQKQAFAGRDIVAEGRDMGTVIFPDADIKFFIKAAEEVRVQRRLEQFMRMNPALDTMTLNSLKEKMKIEIIERDRRDATRTHAPTKAAPEAVIIDNSARSLTEVIDSMYDAVSKKGLV